MPSCAIVATGWSSSSRSRSPGRSRRRASRSGSCASVRRPRSPRSRASSGRTSSATPLRSSGPRRSSSSAGSSSRPGGPSSTARSTSIRGSWRSSTSSGRTSSWRTTWWPSRPCPPRAGRGSGSPRATRPSCSTPTCRRSSPAMPRTIGPAGPRSGRSTGAFMAGCGRTSTRSAGTTVPRACPTVRDGPAFIHESPFLNLYLYPAEVDYPRARPLAPTWHRLDSCVRATEATWELPDPLADRPGALVYLSLGSLGSADVELMRRLVDVLGRTPHRFVVSKGPQHDRVRAGRQHGQAPSSCPSPRSCRWSTWSSPTAATTPSPSASTTASR